MSVRHRPSHHAVQRPHQLQHAISMLAAGSAAFDPGPGVYANRYRGREGGREGRGEGGRDGGRGGTGGGWWRLVLSTTLEASL